MPVMTTTRSSTWSLYDAITVHVDGLWKADAMVMMCANGAVRKVELVEFWLLSRCGWQDTMQLAAYCRHTFSLGRARSLASRS